MKLSKTLLFIGLLCFVSQINVFGQQAGIITGQVYDSLGAVLPNATVTAVDAAGKAKTATTNREGVFTINNLAPGKYTVRANAPTFALYENADVEVVAGKKQELTIALAVQEIQETVEVGGGNQIGTDPNANGDATVLKEKDIENLPDDPDELQQYLQALAGPAAGPDGAQFYIDGFSGGRLPPKEAIREIRINQNPFSSEFDRVGFGRVEILTKPGFDKFRGSAFFNFNDESLNSRNPFSPNRAPSQSKTFGGFISGPIKAKRASYFVDVNSRLVDENSIVAATILDPSFNIIGFNQDFTRPTRRLSISPRFDYQINDSNTLVTRYSFSNAKLENQGVGDFSLPSRAFNGSNTQHEFQLTESAIINAKTVNETRFRYEHNNNKQEGDNSIPTINVSGSFVGGGAQIGLSYSKTNSFEFQNYTTTSLGNNNQHGIKFGAKFEYDRLESRSESGYGGTFIFTGFIDGNGQAVSAIEQYRQNLLGNTDARYNPNLFLLNTGNPLAKVSQFETGLFINDDWKVRPDLLLSFGLRYENQTNINDNLNFAPRFGFAWSPGAGGAKPPKTVFRGGFGIFYNRLNYNTVLQTIRNDGVTQLSYNVSDPAILNQPIFTLNGVTNVPTAAQLGQAIPRSNARTIIAEDFQAPYSMQTALSAQRTLPYNMTLTATYVAVKTERVLRPRNINAPVCPPLTICPNQTDLINALRPNPTLGDVTAYESAGESNMQMVMLGFNARLGTAAFLFGNYRLSFLNTDAEGFPAYSYDLSNEYAPAAFNTRHNFFMGGSISLPYGFRLSPTIIASSGRRFNITTGADTNRDFQFNERPSYAALAKVCSDRGLNNDFCDISGIQNPATTIIPKNYGKGPGSFVMNLGLNKTFGFGGEKQSAAANGGNNPQTTADNQGGRRGGGGGGRRGGGGGGMMGGMGGMFGGGGFGGSSQPYTLTLGIDVRNIFNTVNFAQPIGVLTSDNFGRSISTSGGGGFGFFGRGGGFGGGGSAAANRRVDLSVRFNW